MHQQLRPGRLQLITDSGRQGVIMVMIRKGCSIH
jgi:hypothetical protein